MSWNPLDLVFKKITSRRVTSDNKQFYEEFGDLSFDINSDEVKTQSIDPNPAQAVLDGVAEERTLFALTEDVTVAGQQAWFAEDAGRLKNWLSDKYGAGYAIQLFDGSDNQIFPTDPSDWYFDYVTGVLLFNGSVAGFPKPFKITGYRYIGDTLTDSLLSGGGGGGGYQISDEGVLLPVRSTLDFTGNIVTVTDDSGGDRTVVTVEADAVDITYTPAATTDWDFGTTPGTVQEGLDLLAGTLTAILPAKAPELTGQTLSVSGTTLYSGKIPSGLDPEWYTQAAAGDTVSEIVYDNTFTLSAGQFRAGQDGQPSTYGTASAIVNGVITDQYDMSAGVGSNGVVSVTSITTFNTIWAAALAELNITQNVDGLQTYALDHTEGGTSNIQDIYYDDNVTSPSFSTGISVAEGTKVSKWLSGTEYYGLGSTFVVTGQIEDAFNKTYRETGVAQITMTGSPTVNVDPATVPAFNDPLILNETITLTEADEADLNPDLFVTVRKPNNNNAAQDVFNILVNLGLAISTYGIVSTPTIEFFHDEDKRLYAGTNTAFDSTATLASGEAEVIPGSLTYPATTGTVNFERLFTKASANSGTITFQGINAGSDIDAGGAGDLNVYLLLETEGIYFDLGRAFGNDAGTGDGLSKANAKGARVSSSGSSLDYSLGTFSTANNNNEYRMIVELRTSAAPVINRITTS